MNVAIAGKLSSKFKLLAVVQPVNRSNAGAVSGLPALAVQIKSRLAQCNPLLVNAYPGGLTLQHRMAEAGRSPRFQPEGVETAQDVSVVDLRPAVVDEAVAEIAIDFPRFCITGLLRVTMVEDIGLTRL